jgi:hypothetical protein
MSINTNMSVAPANKMSKTSKVLIAFLVATLALAAFGYLMAHLHSAGNWDGGIYAFDEDYSDSVLAWMIVVPILILTAVFVAVVMLSVGVMVAVLVAIAVVFGLIAAVFGLLFALLPIAAFLAVPVLIIWGIVKMAQRSDDRHAQRAA